MTDHWQYRIESYRRVPGDSDRLTPVKDDLAQVWLGFREKGDDHRCFGAFPSRADAEKAIAILKQQEQQPQPAKDDQPRQGYHTSQRRNGTEDEIIIHAPDGRHMAYIWFWDEGWDGPGAGDKTAKADARRIINALNAYQPANPAPNQAAAVQDRTAKAYHAREDKDSGPFGDGNAIDIRAPSGRTMAFAWLDPDFSREDRAQAKADAQRIVDALNAYQPPPPQHSRQEGIRGTLRKQLDAPASRADAEKAMAILKERDQQPQPAKDDQRGQGYYASISRDGLAKHEVTIHAPDGREMAYLWFMGKEGDPPGVGDKAAKADARRIVDALNAYQPARPAPSQAAGAPLRILPARPERHHAFATKADAQLIADALNAYQPPPPQRSREEAGIRGTLRAQLEAKPTQNPGQDKKPKRPKEPDRGH
jgi:hypothetical protein